MDCESSQRLGHPRIVIGQLLPSRKYLTSCTHLGMTMRWQPHADHRVPASGPFGGDELVDVTPQAGRSRPRVVEKPRTWRSAAHSPTLAYHEEQVRRWATRRSDLPVVNGQVSRDGQASPWGAVLGCIRPSRLSCASITYAQLNSGIELPLSTRFQDLHMGTNLLPFDAARHHRARRRRPHRRNRRRGSVGERPRHHPYHRRPRLAPG